MIKKILNKLFSQKIDDEHLECAIDEDKVDCGHLDDDQDKAYVGVPAPILNPIVTGKQFVENFLDHVCQ